MSRDSAISTPATTGIDVLPHRADVHERPRRARPFGALPTCRIQAEIRRRIRRPAGRMPQYAQMAGSVLAGKAEALVAVSAGTVY